jgi:predicted GIY-YIG superfamily endonuclease
MAKSAPARYLYMLRCSDNSIYTGITNDPADRINKHNDVKYPDSYTSSRLPVSFHLVLDTEHNAYKIEQYIKGKWHSNNNRWTWKMRMKFIYRWRKGDQMELDDEVEEWLVGTRNVTDLFEPRTKL